MKLSHYSLKSFAALINDYKTVSKVYPDIIFEAEKRILSNQKVYYVGVKNTNVIPYDLVREIEKMGFLHHTDDALAKGGRAIDLNLINPITGRFMTGSSSGSALNVFYDINDVGIGTDGGGSVLAPAIALNLIGFISPLIYEEEMLKHQKESTDGIVFSPSIGFISKSLKTIQELANFTIKMSKPANLDVLVSNAKLDYHKQLLKKVEHLGEKIDLTYNNLSREILMQDLREVNFNENILVSFEGPVDVFAYGDSLMGHYSSETKALQSQGEKYYLTVVNMLNLTSIIIPSQKHGCGILLSCKSKSSHILQTLNLAKQLVIKQSELEKRYFSIHTPKGE